MKPVVLIMDGIHILRVMNFLISHCQTSDLSRTGLILEKVLSDSCIYTGKWMCEELFSKVTLCMQIDFHISTPDTMTKGLSIYFR